jgi:hypothetical protein
LGYPSDFLELHRCAGPPERGSKRMDKEKVEKIVKEVILNYEAQEEWNKDVDPDFLTAMETFIKRYSEDQSISREQLFRTGVMLGAVYERWRVENRKE